ncbi:MAG: TerB N-terminal domain-containing protein [Pseudomonadota bacterium]
MAKKSGGSGLLVVGAIVLSLLAAIPKEAWIGLAVVVALYFGLRAYFKKSADIPVQSVVEPMQQPPVVTQRSAVGGDRFITVNIGSQDQEYGIPQPIHATNGKARWVPPGESVEVAGLSLPAGMLYVGSGLSGSYGQTEPSLINPALKVTKTNIDLGLRLTDYWPNYSECTPDARRAYLQWLADGRRAPEANIGYVFLFFYGLERRVLVDARTDTDAKADIPAIKLEVERLLGIYSTNNSFRHYASQFLGYIDAETVEPASYKQSPPSLGSSYELPMRLKIGLGQLAVDQQPVPASWALAWALADPNITRRTAVGRCPEMFEALFKTKYAEAHGEGLRLPVNRTKLKLSYQAASGSLRGYDFTRNIGELPDVSALSAPVKKLQDLVTECTDLLDPYSRFLGRNPDKKEALEGLLLLPAANWPAPVRAELDDIKVKVGNGMLVLSFGELTGKLKSAGALSRDKVLGLARALESLHLGMEPDVLGGRKLPKAEDKIALFAIDPADGEIRGTPAYQAAAVTLDLASSVALADGDASATELLHLTRQIDSWTHLSVSHRKRLKAHLRLCIAQPATLAGLKKHIEPLAAETKRAVAKFLAHLAEADGTVTPNEVKLLERVYKTLQLDAKLVYSDLHSAGTPGKPAAAPQATKAAPAAGFVLDPQRIAQLQKETEEVTALLSGVFAEEAPEIQVSIPEEEEPEVKTSVLGLDPGYVAFLRLLTSRSSWTRQELDDAAADMELMLDGALEHINEAALDHFDAPLIEGDDPVEINQEVLEKLPV